MSLVLLAGCPRGEDTAAVPCVGPEEHGPFEVSTLPADHEAQLTVDGRWVVKVTSGMAPSGEPWDCCNALGYDACDPAEGCDWLAQPACDGPSPLLYDLQDDFDIQPLFAPDDDNTMPAVLAPFCLLTYKDRAVSPTPGDADIALGEALVDLAELGLLGADAVGPDRAVVVPQGSTAGAAYGAALNAWAEARFDEDLGRVSNVVDVAGAGNPVRVVMLDTDPDGGVGVSEHGPQAHAALRRLVCDAPDNDATCAVHVETRLGLPLDAERGPLDVANLRGGLASGGLVGTPAFLAQAVRQAVVDAGPDRLVVNLSLGIAPMHVSAPYPADIEALQAALQNAVDQEALVIAAAGNETAGPQGRSGLFYPAAWTDLVVPAGGVSLGGHPLSRPDGRPALNAHSEHVVADPALRSLTGSSVSAIGVSSAAALVWALDPLQSPADVVTTVYNAATPDWGAAPQPYALATDAVDPVGADARRVSPLQALEHACVAGPCGATPVGFTSAALVDLGPAREDFDKAAALQVPTCTTSYVTTQCADAYGSPIPVALNLLSYGAGASLHPCPELAVYDHSAIPVAMGQPDQNPCPPCELNLTSLGQFARVENTHPTADAQVVLNVVDANGERQDYHLGLVQADQLVNFDLAQLPSLAGTQSAKVTLFATQTTTTGGQQPITWLQPMPIITD